ncbi:MAG: hypothetical protein Q8M69_12935 [Reyranella sp.]|nr:hypothetical protein [Reyranella sp.]
MDDSDKKSSRELVTLPADLAERVEAFRERSGITSKSESLKMLIEGGLRRYDTREDLFARCEAATRKGQSLGDLITLVTADHPLVQSTSLDMYSLDVFLRPTSPDEPEERFRFSRIRKRWTWEYQHPNDGDWRPKPKPQRASGDDDDYGSGSGRAVSRGKAQLDDDIPF